MAQIAAPSMSTVQVWRPELAKSCRSLSDRFSPVLRRSATAYGVRSDIVLNDLLAYAVATAKRRKAIHAQAFNVGRPEENYRVQQLAEHVRGLSPAPVCPMLRRNQTGCWP